LQIKKASNAITGLLEHFGSKQNSPLAKEFAEDPKVGLSELCNALYSFIPGHSQSGAEHLAAVGGEKPTSISDGVAEQDEENDYEFMRGKALSLGENSSSLMVC